MEKLEGLEWGKLYPKYINVLIIFAENVGTKEIWITWLTLI